MIHDDASALLDQIVKAAPAGIVRMNNITAAFLSYAIDRKFMHRDGKMTVIEPGSLIAGHTVEYDNGLVTGVVKFLPHPERADCMTLTELSEILKPRLGDDWLMLACLALGVSRRTRHKWHQLLSENPDSVISTAPDFRKRLARLLTEMADRLDDGADALDPDDQPDRPSQA